MTGIFRRVTGFLSSVTALVLVWLRHGHTHTHRRSGMSTASASPPISRGGAITRLSIEKDLRNCVTMAATHIVLCVDSVVEIAANPPASPDQRLIRLTAPARALATPGPARPKPDPAHCAGTRFGTPLGGHDSWLDFGVESLDFCAERLGSDVESLDFV